MIMTVIIGIGTTTTTKPATPMLLLLSLLIIIIIIIRIDMNVCFYLVTMGEVPHISEDQISFFGPGKWREFPVSVFFAVHV